MNRLNCGSLTRTCHLYVETGDMWRCNACFADIVCHNTVRQSLDSEKQNNQHMRHLTSRLRARPGHGHGQLRDSIRTKALRGGVAAPLVLLALASTVPVVQGTGV